MKLTARSVAAARFDGKPRKYFDGHGLYLHVSSASRVWRYGYRLHGKQKTFTIGPVDLISLAQARELHRDARKQVTQGLDPVAQRRAAQAVSDTLPMGEVMDRWLLKRQQVVAASNGDKIASRLKHLKDRFCSIPLDQLEPVHIMEELTAIANRRSADLAHRVLGYLKAALDEQVAEGLIANNPAVHPAVAVRMPERKPQKRYAHTTKVKTLGSILKKIDGYIGEHQTACALWLMPRLFLRPGELRSLTWEEVNFEDRQLEFDAVRMKKNNLPFLSPLSDQCFERIKSLHEDRRSDYVFYSPRNLKKPISDMTLSYALKRLKIPSSLIVPHGFRHTASTFLNERKFVVNGEEIRFQPDAIEAQLAHVQVGVRGRYNRAQYIDERRVMMQAYSDWLDSITS